LINAVLSIQKIQKNHSFTILPQKKLFIKQYSKALKNFEFLH